MLLAVRPNLMLFTLTLVILNAVTKHYTVDERYLNKTRII
jgi:hypothetical protein